MTVRSEVPRDVLEDLIERQSALWVPWYMIGSEFWHLDPAFGHPLDEFEGGPRHSLTRIPAHCYATASSTRFPCGGSGRRRGQAALLIQWDVLAPREAAVTQQPRLAAST
jgi:hypothetical protein